MTAKLLTKRRKTWISIIRISELCSKLTDTQYFNINQCFSIKSKLENGLILLNNAKDESTILEKYAFSDAISLSGLFSYKRVFLTIIAF